MRVQFFLGHPVQVQNYHQMLTKLLISCQYFHNLVTALPWLPINWFWIWKHTKRRCLWNGKLLTEGLLCHYDLGSCNLCIINHLIPWKYIFASGKYYLVGFQTIDKLSARVVFYNPIPVSKCQECTFLCGCQDSPLCLVWVISQCTESFNTQNCIDLISGLQVTKADMHICLS